MWGPDLAVIKPRPNKRGLSAVETQAVTELRLAAPTLPDLIALRLAAPTLPDLIALRLAAPTGRNSPLFPVLG